MHDALKILVKMPSLIEISNYVRKHGVLFPIQIVIRFFDIISEINFDRKHGVNTGFIIPADKLNYEDKDIQKQASMYRPSPPYIIAKGLKVLRKVSSLSFKEETIIDYGCGAGRIMIIAAECGFKNIVGIELSPYLVELCRKNIITYSHSNNNCNLIVLKQNAAEYIPPTEASVFFFYVPFGTDIYKQVIFNIKKSFNANHRTIYVLDYFGYLKDFDFTHEGFQVIKKLGDLNILTIG